MRLLAATPELVNAEVSDRALFASEIGVVVPAEWPPNVLRDAREFFLGLYREHPDWIGWLHWYGVLVGSGGPVLCASAGFMGPPDADGTIEIGYSVLPQFQR